MTAVSAIKLKAACARWHIELIVSNEDMLGAYLKILGCKAHSFTAVVHEGVRD